MLEVQVNAAGTWRERVRALTGEVSQTVSLAVVTTNCEKSAEAIKSENWRLCLLWLHRDDTGVRAEAFFCDALLKTIIVIVCLHLIRCMRKL